MCGISSVLPCQIQGLLSLQGRHVRKSSTLALMKQRCCHVWRNKAVGSTAWPTMQGTLHDLWQLPTVIDFISIETILQPLWWCQICNYWCAAWKNRKLRHFSWCYLAYFNFQSASDLILLQHKLKQQENDRFRAFIRKSRKHRHISISGICWCGIFWDTRWSKCFGFGIHLLHPQISVSVKWFEKYSSIFMRFH